MSRPARSAPHRARRRVVVTATVLVTCAVLAACGGTSPSPSASGKPGAPLPGLTAQTVRVGFTVDAGGALAAGLGTPAEDQGDIALRTRIIQAYVDYVNASGGAGGRRIIADIKPYASSTASLDQDRDLCKSFTTDSGDFAAVLDGQDQPAVLPCYQAANTLMIDESLVPHDATEFSELSPYLWSPTHPEYTGLLAAQLDAMRVQGYFVGVDGVQLIALDDAVGHRAIDSVVRPFLTSIDVNSMQTDYVDGSNIAALSSSTSSAVASGAAGGFTRVLIVGGGRTMALALANQDAGEYFSTWGVSTFDSPGYLQDNPDSIVTEAITGASGIGYAPAYDVGGTEGGPFPDTSRPNEVLCKGVLDAVGITPGAGERSNYRTAFQYCDAVLFLKAALDQGPDGATMTALQFKDAVGRIGPGYSSSLTFGGEFKPGQYAATNAGRVLTFDASCACFKYKGDHVPISAS